MTCDLGAWAVGGSVAVLWLAACGSAELRGGAEEVHSAPGTTSETPHASADPRARAEAGGWSGAGLMPQPYYCNDEGGTEWCDGANDDDCDGAIDEGCADCVDERCERYAITPDEVRRGASREGGATCIGPIYCGRIDGYADTSPPGGCGDFHCGTILWSDGTAEPYHCTIYGRCVDGEFIAQGFSW